MPARADLSFISMFVLHPSQHQQGYGREVMEGVIDQSKTMGDRMALGARVYLKNWPALRFWVGLGFKQIDKMDGDKIYSETMQASLVLLRPV